VWWSVDGLGFAIVVAMSDNHVDPSGNTEAFRAFTQSAPPEPQTANSRTPLIVAGAAAAVVVLALIIWLVS
jgi:hypothetical protein